MKKLRRLIACLALLLGLTGVAVATQVVPASAYLYNCSVTVYDPSHVQSLCWDSFPGGYNQQRVQYRCGNASRTVSGGYFYGSWVGTATYSFGSCVGKSYAGQPTPYIWIVSSAPVEPTYQLR